MAIPSLFLLIMVDLVSVSCFLSGCFLSPPGLYGNILPYSTKLCSLLTIVLCRVGTLPYGNKVQLCEQYDTNLQSNRSAIVS